MPASYVHQCIARTAAGALFSTDSERHALLAGAEGPDPLFFSFFGKPCPPAVASSLHTKKTDDFLLALCEACKVSPLTRAYCCGFFTHYAGDTTFHPFVYAHSLTPDGAYSGTVHCTLEHQLETLRYRRDGHASGLPVQMAGFAALTAPEKDEIARAFAEALAKVFPNQAMKPAAIRRSFDDSVHICHILRSESGRKYRTLGAVLSPFKLDAPLHAHMMPVEPPAADIANDAHAAWCSIWEPERSRNESCQDLFDKAVARSQQLVDAALGFMDGRVSAAVLRALHGGLSYDSGLPWQDTCPAKVAPGVPKPARS